MSSVAGTECVSFIRSTVTQPTKVTAAAASTTIDSTANGAESDSLKPKMRVLAERAALREDAASCSVNGAGRPARSHCLFANSGSGAPSRGQASPAPSHDE